MYIFSKAIDILLKEFPELRQFYDDDYEDLMYLFYETEFGNYVMKNVLEHNEVELRKIFDFTERLFTDGDEKMKNLAGVGIVERLYFEKEFMVRYEFLSKYLGQLTRTSFEDSIEWFKNYKESTE